MGHPTRTTAAAALALIGIAALTSSNAAPQVDAGVHRLLHQQGTANIFVTMKQGTEPVLHSVSESTSQGGRGEKIHALVNALEALASESQKEVLDLLAQEAAESNEPLFAAKKSFWISNQIYFQQASPTLINKLAQVNAIESISPEEVYPLPEVISSSINDTVLDATSVEWGVQRIEAPAMWQKGYTGEGIVVGAIDTGVRGTHEALRNNFRGDYGWFDPENHEAQPYDPKGHGTHVMGTIAGANGIGVAPGVKWMACKGCRVDGCQQSDLLACAEFMTCPTDPSGNNKDCSKAPRVVSNSWGGGQNSKFFAAAAETWEKAGIIPVFSIGNNGPSCGTAVSPGDLPHIISVGATTMEDGLADFSSKGPAVGGGYLKPDLSAPGKDVRSAWPTGDSAYRTLSGTSMAAPHVSGAIALLLQFRSSLNTFVAFMVLGGDAETKTLKPFSGDQCGTLPNDRFPNNGYGYGRINVLRAMETLAKA